MPFPEVSGGIAVFFEHFGDGRFAFQEVHPVEALVEDGVDSSAWVESSCEKSSARGGACWSS